MKGRKPDLKNVARLPGVEDRERASEASRLVAVEKARELRPWGMGEGANKVWDRLAPELVLLGRLKAHFVDALAEYCRITVRLAEWRRKLDAEEWTYVVDGRNGEQIKSRPEVAQLNDDWRKWRSLTASFGMTPTDERGLAEGQGDLFDDGWGDI